MSYVQDPNLTQHPSARARLAVLRDVVDRPYGNNEQLIVRRLILDVADILLDAMRDGPDVGRVEQLPTTEKQA